MPTLSRQSYNAYIKMTISRYSDYDAFAWVYNQHWGDQFTPTALEVMEKLLLPWLPSQARILDLCCGTGQLARVLSDRGYRVTGIDGSAEMLRFARENAPGVEFVQDDARSFELPRRYHGVVCVFDSLNHIASLDEMTSVFHRVFTALKEGGLFLFDLNLDAGYKAHWNGVFGIIEDDHVCVIRDSYDSSSKTAHFDATIFRLQDSWHRSNVTLRQKGYSDTEIRSALQRTGFTEIQAHAYNKEKGLRELTETAERAFFVCRKPRK